MPPKFQATIAVRRVEAKDKAAWLALFRDYIAFYRTTVPDVVIDAVFAHFMAATPGAHIGLVAVDAGDRLVGLAHILLHRSTWSTAPDCYLEDLFVSPPARGGGIGRALIEAVYREADGQGCRRTYWVTEETNSQARALYDRLATKSVFVQYRR